MVNRILLHFEPVAAVGCGVDIEVDFLNAELWAADLGEIVATVKQRYLDVVVRP